MCLTEKSISYSKRLSRGKYPLQIHNMYKEQISKKTPKIVGEWSAWSPWSPCSRSCGGGITQQTRQCITRPADSRFARRQRRRRQYKTSGCVGLYKRIQLCNRTDCPAGRDFRYEQCAAFNHKKLNGKTYYWEPFLQAPDECALNCRPLGRNFYAILNKTVIDGTACSRPTTSTGRAAPRGTKGVCIDGYCKSVNSHGVVGSIDEIEDECMACRKGACRGFNGIYTRPDLPPGYSVITQIPQGACRILVQQLKHTRNFLALRNSNGSFLLNGDWKFSNSRTFEGAGTKFNYIKQDSNSLETISSSGPLANAIDIMIINYQANPGVKYGFVMPIKAEEPEIAPPLIKRPYDDNLEPRRLDPPPLNSLNQRDEGRPSTAHRRTRLRRKFSWKVAGLSACSKSCGGGIQTAILTCIREHTQTPVVEKRCAHLEKPVTHPLECGTVECPPSWKGHWSSCSASCGQGVERFSYECIQQLNNGRSVILNDASCPWPKPAIETRACNRPPCDRISDNELPNSPDDASFKNANNGWTVGPWSPCSLTCGTGHRTRSVTCPSGICHAENRPTHAEYCDMGPCHASQQLIPQSSSQHANPHVVHNHSPWLLTEWSQCSEACGTGTQTRFSFCLERQCDTGGKPELSRACSSEKQCSGQWFTGPWGSCSDSCGGQAKQAREVFCIVKIRGQSHITNEKTCTSHLKPHTEQACEGTCPPQWFFGDWGTCEGSCPTGFQRRMVRCMDVKGDNANGCNENNIPEDRRMCACQRRDDHKDRYRPAQDEPVDRSCVDKSFKCQFVVQARLCNYPYYASQCCLACKKSPQNVVV